MGNGRVPSALKLPPLPYRCFVLMVFPFFHTHTQCRVSAAVRLYVPGDDDHGLPNSGSSWLAPCAHAARRDESQKGKRQRCIPSRKTRQKKKRKKDDKRISSPQTHSYSPYHLLLLADNTRRVHKPVALRCSARLGIRRTKGIGAHQPGAPAGLGNGGPHQQEHVQQQQQQQQQWQRRGGPNVL